MPGARLVAVLVSLVVFSSGGLLLTASADHPQSTPAGTVTFDHRGGNEWWVEAVVTHDGVRPDQVDARDEGDSTWHALEFKDWGEWGGSFHIEPGNRVMFRSTTSAGSAESCWFTHPAGVEECDSTPPPPPGDFDATFDTPGGNDWWVEVYVDGNEPIAGVDARANGGAWQELTKRSWGAWAKSFHVPDGSIVEFRAHSSDGDVDMSGGYRWPSGEPVSEDPDPDPDPEPPATFDAAFAPKASNEWWIETYAVANSSISSVEARRDGGAWHSLTLRSWGAWAGSFHAPSGSEVEFRATNSEGAVGQSVAFAWPGAVPAAEQGEAWPHEGSYVRYDEFYDPPGGFRSEGKATFVYHNDAWRVWCIGMEGFEGDLDPYNHYNELPPPRNPTLVTPGMTVASDAYTCGERQFDVIVQHSETHGIHHEGDGVTVSTWYAERTADCLCIRYEAEWEHELGLVVEWTRAGREAIGADLEDTDAPVV